ncbi:pyruvate dehydrogenase E1 component beta subunit PdhB3 [Acetobacterium woodii DSM 1030]|uniref:Pyruvate dehydrogenase E1 component beta subunit PdhB3 n=1 Tax=Acetobacterium woodii (strain ATCC 29683 / DSM 1030 / JCM 2381 / KCTC 1655 / WB1) TaxID=931626 RepID=H6LHI5_ACEWD|nr:alpha-ketoacid dehydrogenase subunit beta [Acetobacterium woodii]AFA49695.1 pyruvate dehydrogenase E1 component beta subunit PdhB3 [Acetobacterium woodii DSM 1030]
MMKTSDMKKMTYRDAIRMGISEEMRRDDDIIFLGEDIGQHGGAFGVSTGLLAEFGAERILDTPIAEAAIVGTAVGAATTGLRPICEMMFMDFITFGMDALVNQGAKMAYMFGGQSQVPMVLRLPSGSGLGGGAQHSQSLEAWLCHVPGLKVVTPSTPAQAKGLIKAAIRDNNPVCFIEHKLLYDTVGLVPLDDNYLLELNKTVIERPGKDVTIVAYGTVLAKAIEAADFLEEEGIKVEILNPISLYPLDMKPIIESVIKTGCLIVAHEASKTGGLGGEIVARIVESEAFDYLNAPIIRLGGLDVPIPFNQELEAAVVPQRNDFVHGVYRLLNRE